jgi:hypothetical protein
MRAEMIGRIAKLLALLAVAAACFGCAHAPVAHKEFARVPQDKGRIFFYRLGGAPVLRPDIHLNDKVVGESHSSTYFYRDVNPGKYTVMTKTEASNDVSFTLAAGETKYVRIDMAMGFFVGHPKPKLIPAAEAEPEIDEVECAETASKPVSTRMPAGAK